MILSRVDVFLFLFFFMHENTPLKAQPCKVCQERNFSRTSESCICSGDYFCNTTSHECTKCGNCYDAWNNVIKDKKGEIKNMLKKLIKRYEVNLAELKNLLDGLTIKINKGDHELEDINTKTNQAGKKISKLADDIKKLKEDINKVEEQLKKIENVLSVEELVEYLKMVKDKMKTIQEKLNNLYFNIDDVELFDIDKFKIISSHLNDMNKNFPVIEDNSLNLALSLESDIDILESIILKFSNNDTNEFNMNINEKTEWIEKDLLWLFTLLNHYENDSIDTNGLLKKASAARSSAVKTDSTLKELLQKHEDFDIHLKELKSETQFYRELQEVQKRLNKLNVDVKNYKNLMIIFRKKEELHRELEKFKKERDAFDKKESEASKYKSELDELLKEEEGLLIKFEHLEDVKPIDEVIMDIENMIEEVRHIENEVATHCSSSISNPS